MFKPISGTDLHRLLLTPLLITEILLTIQVYQHEVPHNPQHIADKFVCHVVVNNVFKTHSTGVKTVISGGAFKKSKLHICFVLNIFND